MTSPVLIGQLKGVWVGDSTNEDVDTNGGISVDLEDHSYSRLQHQAAVLCSYSQTIHITSEKTTSLLCIRPAHRTPAPLINPEPCAVTVGLSSWLQEDKRSSTACAKIRCSQLSSRSLAIQSATAPAAAAAGVSKAGIYIFSGQAARGERPAGRSKPPAVKRSERVQH
ncbi:hypothetical protein ILYODFUR_028731 [Ilyodon furcidens]|uniref:Uncharacterized protein n=1 Tax=Ilyodon furcidens TaxID=33524 RepID=A0ABV0UB24_9TELE